MISAQQRLKQVQAILGTTPDGIAGPKTEAAWQALKAEVKREIDSDLFPWLTIARRELGVSEVAGSGDNPRIVEYHTATSLKATDDETPWCAAFVNWCLREAGYIGTNSAAAGSFIDWGLPLAGPREGCIIVFPRKGGAHVGFCAGRVIDGQIPLLGGNQGDRVSIANHPQAKAVSYRWPKERMAA